MMTDKTSRQILSEVTGEIPSDVLFPYGAYEHNNVSKSLFWDTHDMMVSRVILHSDDICAKIKQALNVRFTTIRFVEVRIV